MSLSVGSLSAGSTALGGQLLIERFSLGSPAASSAGLATGRATPLDTPEFSRLVSLVERVGAQALEAAQSGGSRLEGRQAAIDTALAEISYLVGQQLALGGAKNASVVGLDPSQVVDYEVRSLQPNASVAFGGVSIDGQRAPSVSISGLSRLRSQGGALTLGPANASQTLSFSAGTSTGQILDKLSRAGGFEASAVGDSLEISSRLSSGLRSLRVVAQYGRPTANANGYEAVGVDSSQIASVDASQLTTGLTFAVSGSRQTESTSAELSYSGNGSDVAGTASFRLTGDAGSSLLTANQGESLATFAQRINDATADTGVIAEIEGDTLRFRSLATGSTATVSLAEIVRDTGVSIDGVNAAQFADLQATSIPDEASLTLTGSVTQAAAAAQQVYQGTAGQVSSDADFTVTGSLGSAQVTIVEGETLADVAGRINGGTATTGVSARVEGDNLYFESTTFGAAAVVTIDNVTTATETVASGVNAAQVASFTPSNLPEGSSVVIAGEVTRAADNARQTYAGGSGATVVDTATFTLGGTLGTAQFAITEGEALADVAGRINDQSASTGVAATVVGNNLEFTSTDVGSAANVQVTLDSVAQYVTVDGVNGAQLSDFVVTNAEPGSVKVLSGTVDAAATRGELTYSGFLGNTTGAATFTLAGELGSAQFSVNAFQSLASVRDEINAESASTGVAATLAGNTLTLSSSGYGSAAIVEVDVQSGTFNTSGGDGQGAAAGTDAQLTLNGQAYTSEGLDVAFDDGTNQYALTLVAGFAGALDAVTVTSADGDFAVSGGDAGGNAVGVDAAATLNGQALVATGETFNATIDGLSFSLQSVAGYTGTVDPITVESVSVGFDLTGGDENGTAYGVDATATLNGQNYTATGNALSVTIEGIDLDLTLAEGFVGAIDDITISSAYQDFTVTGGDGSGTANGSDASAIINGQTLTSDGDTFVYQSESGPLSLQFAADHQGDFKTFDLVSRSIETRVFSASADSARRDSFSGGTVEREGGKVIVRRGGAEIALQLAAGFRGELNDFKVAAAGTVAFTQTTDPLGAATSGSAATAVRSLIKLASGGEAALTAGTTHRALAIAYTALQDLLTLSNGAPTGGLRRSLVGLNVDARI